MSEIPESQENSDKKKKVENNEKPTMFRVTLKVAESAPDNSGIYTLTVTNSRGDQTARISVGVRGQFISYFFILVTSDKNCKSLY